MLTAVQRICLGAVLLAGCATGVKYDSAVVEDVERLRAVHASAGELIARAKVELMALPEFDTDVSFHGPEGARAMYEWTEWRTAWRQELENLSRALPESPGRLWPEDLRRSWMSLRETIDALSAAVEPSGESPIPPKQYRQAWIRSAEKSWRKMRGLL